jgi:hypothetical protein
MVRPPDQRSADRLPTFPVTVFFLLASINSTRQMRRPLPFATFRSYPGDVLISPWRAISRLSPQRPRGVYLPSLQHPRGPKTTRGFTEPVRAPGPLGPTALPETKPARVGPQTVHAMLNAGWPALLAAHSFLLTTNLSDSIFGGHPTVGALQTLARAAGRLALPTHVMRSSLPSHSHHASSPRSMNRNRLRLT